MTRGKIIILLAVYLSNAGSKDVESQTYGRDWVVFADDTGKRHYVNLIMPLDPRIYNEKKNYVDVEPTYWLYTRNTINNPEQIFLSVKNSNNYIQNAPLVVVTHGWMGNRDVNSTQFVKNAILTDMDCKINVVIMDWSIMGNKNYVRSAYNTFIVAEKLKNFVKKFAKQYAIDASKIHLIGHSLGAHVVGLAGAKLKDTNFLVSRVTGLDPARPFFEVPNVFPTISKNSAAFVDIIHTSIKILGMCKPIGHADFYPGGGILHPTLCPTSLLGICEHSCSYIYFAKSLTNKFEARKCPDYLSYTLGVCDNNEIQFMGYPCKATARDTYFLDIATISKLNRKVQSVKDNTSTQECQRN